MGMKGSEGCVDEECGQLERASIDQPRTFPPGVKESVEVGGPRSWRASGIGTECRRDERLSVVLKDQGCEEHSEEMKLI